MNILLQCVYAFFSSVGFSIIFNVRKEMVIYAAIAGALGCLSYELVALFSGAELAQYFMAALTIAFFCEIIARVKKVPVTVCLIPGMIPYVPGGGIYYTMMYFINGDTQEFLTSFVQTVSIAGALSFGIILMSSLVRLFYDFKSRKTVSG